MVGKLPLPPLSTRNSPCCRVPLYSINVFCGFDNIILEHKGCSRWRGEEIYEGDGS